MRDFMASAPGKVILLGEHAVVYNRPAIAVPVNAVEATSEVSYREGGVFVKALDFAKEYDITKRPLKEGDDGFALQETVYHTYEYLQKRPEDVEIRVTSTIPVAAGMGSGAAIAVSMIRAIAGYLKKELLPEEVNYLAYKTEIIHHGTPSGIDNTVITYNKPVYFISEPRKMERLDIAKPFMLVIGDTGIRSNTKEVVAMVRENRKKNYSKYKQIWNEIADIVNEARDAIINGDIEHIGPLMNRNHELLKQIHVSCDELDKLVDAALDAGAIGAKLSGAGRGGDMIALVNEGTKEDVANALRRAGAKNVIITEVKP
ncbi:MAG: mevalonate kinase [Candidatus Diapherotrites archaeon]|nr:mevalonate kinase [Candidatus Diapherotrites archaeon]